ncbi:DUF6151 family protein [uncultured Litoreibacter sp.]|uniref:DUF6151 family protein n=1 Tax=uncultured Litoreibacter sp. TaxID=1392394 RepID=UPI0026378766|nr:DUF6151 family protein [uncultured Litoreibacter sp.]
MTPQLTLSCQCGEFQAVIHGPSASSCNHAMCYCKDCRAFAHHLNQEDHILDSSGGTDLYQTQPSQVEITAGADKLAVLQLAPKGLYRWHTSCCNTAICNTMGNPKLSFVGFMSANLTNQESLGPVTIKYKPDQATGPVPEPHGSLLRFAGYTIRNMLKARVSGTWKNTPFFGEDGRSVVKPVVLSEAEREAAYAR